MKIADKVSKNRIENQIKTLAQIGATGEGGITRLPYTKDERAAVALVKSYMEEAGLQTFFDQFGNLFGKLEGKSTEAPVVMTGSHVDTVINGGAFDGVIGTLGAIEALRVIRENNIPHVHTLEACVFVSEEPVRFRAGTLGSKAAIGDFTQSDLDRLKDKDNISLAQAIKECGFNPEQLESVRRDPAKIKCFVELHIEQSIILETKKLPIGVVDQIAAPTNFRLTLKGKAGHAGATPMNMRNDAFMAAAEIALEIERIAITIGKEAVGTVGEVKVIPNAINVIPGEVILGIDVRDVTSKRKDEAIAEIEKSINNIAARRNIEAVIEIIQKQEPVKTSPQIVDIISSTCNELGLPWCNITSGAYHDALNMAKITDIGMIFIPSAGGISHAKEEFSSIDDIYQGARVLAEVLVKLAS
ncbi:MAG: M20 family metallo-hydrolase [Dethiobacter sp.]|nr:M20 family metallo-hydrolase [Dethiobacter sp.]